MGIVCGGPPVLLKSKDVLGDASPEKRVVTVQNYSWADSKGKVKIYITIPEGELPDKDSSSLVEVKFAPNSVDVTAKLELHYRWKLSNLFADIDPERCSVRVEPKKNRVVLQ